MGVAVIHVVDDQAHSSKDFRCDIKLLLAHMKLLAADLEDVPGQDIEITVKCDISTFAWLMAYVKAESRGQQPQITLDNCLQLLLASHYLQMSPVLKSSVAYIATNLLDLAPSAAAQLCSLDSCLLDKLAKAVQEETLEALHHTHHQQQEPQQPVADSPANSDPKHSQRSTSSGGGSSSSACALVEKLYKHKLRALLQQQNSTVLRCKACGQLFASASHHKLQCPAGEAPQNRQYRLPLHDPDQGWDLQTFLTQQRTATNIQQRKHKSDQPQQQPHGTQQEQKLDQQPNEQQQQHEASSWRELYWLVWGYVVVLYCQRCCSHFPARLLHQCSYHPLPAVFTSDEVIGRYPCCGAPAWQPGGNAVVAAAAASLQPCCSRDHDAYVPAGSSWQGQQVLQQPGAARKGPKGGKGAPVDPKRALQLLRLFGPVITAAAPASIQQQQQLQQQEAVMLVAAARQPAAQKQRGPVLPLLVKMVNRGASAAAAAAAAGCVDGLSGAVASGSGAGSKTPGSQPTSRPSSVSPLPPISPRQCSAEQQVGTRPTTSSSAQLHQGQIYSVPAAAAAAMAAAADANGTGRASLYSATSATGHTADADSSSSSSRSGSSTSDSEGSSSSSGSSSESDEQVEYLNIDDTAADDDDQFNLSGAHATPLSSVMGAVRAAAEARTKGVGLSSSTAGSSAGRMHQMGAPLAETFSAGGRRVLATGGRKPLRSSNLLDTSSRPSTAASLLSLSGKQQQLVGQSPSRPGTSSSVGRMARAPAAAGGGGGGRAESVMGGLSAVGAAFNRTLLLELVQQDDAYHMGVLMRKLDSLRLQPPPDCGEQRQAQQGRLGQPQQLTQVDVMKAVNGVLFEGKYA